MPDCLTQLINDLECERDKMIIKYSLDYADLDELINACGILIDVKEYNLNNETLIDIFKDYDFEISNWLDQDDMHLITC